MERKRKGDRKIRFWCAGCSSGEEAYSIVITILDAIDNPLIWNISVLATDLSNKMLQIAKSGIYHKEKISDLTPALLKKYFLKGQREWKDYVKVKDHLKQHIEFQRLNLKEPFHIKEGFDCIFCRNVMIYLDKPIQLDILNRFYKHLNHGGILIIGHSESISWLNHSFQYVRPSIYRKI